MRLAVAAALLALPTVAAADPSITAGISLGAIQSKVDGVGGATPNQTLGVFGRLAFGKRVAGQLEVGKTETDASYVTMRKGTALLVVDLGSRGRLVPVLFAGIGLDHATTNSGYTEQSAHHIEGGLGLEYRADSLILGIDARMGGRTLDGSDQVVPLAGDTREPGIAYIAPSGLREGEYRSARVTLGLRF